MALAVTNDGEWLTLRRLLGEPARLADDRFSSRGGRVKYAGELDALISGATQSHDAYELMDSLQDAGVSAGVVQTAEDLWNDPQVKHWGFFQWLEHSECGPMPYNGPPAKLSRTPGRLRWAAPTVGQHNIEVLRGVLRLSEDDVADLFAAGALESSF